MVTRTPWPLPFSAMENSDASMHAFSMLCLTTLLLCSVQCDFIGHTTKTEAGPKFRVLAFGDSITAGHVLSPEDPLSPYAAEIINLAKADNFPNLEVVEEGVSGELVVPTMTERCSQLLSLAQASGNKYTHVLILGGVNDLSAELATDAILQGLRHMYKAVEDHGARVVGMTIFASKYEHPGYPKYDIDRRALNALITDYIKGQDKGKYQLVDLDAAFPRNVPPPDPAQGPSYWADRVHLTAAGYKRMGQVLYEQVLKPLKPATAFKRPWHATVGGHGSLHRIHWPLTGASG